jgi:hypothetical protein
MANPPSVLSENTHQTIRAALRRTAMSREERRKERERMIGERERMTVNV